MTSHVSKLGRVGALAYVWALAACMIALAQQTTWDALMSAAGEAYQQRNYGEAEKLYAEALRQAEEFGPADPRLAANLNNLAESYEKRGRFVEAEPLYIGIWRLHQRPSNSLQKRTNSGISSDKPL